MFMHSGEPGRFLLGLGERIKFLKKKLDKVIDPNRLHNKKPYDTIRREMDLDISTNAL